MEQEYIEELFERFKNVLGADYERYRNHVYRVFLNTQTLDTNKDNEKKYAIAAVFHDIGIWTDRTFDYLDPSIKQVELFLAEINREEWHQEISQMIYWHHKIKPYTGEFESTVEVFRKADWIDVSLGILRFKQSKSQIAKNKSEFPNKGFHLFLVKQTIKNFLKHPLNPIPVFKK